jgi:hypothetical protein
MSANKLTYFLHLRVFFTDYPGFLLAGNIYFPTNQDNRESTVIVMNGRHRKATYP